MASLIEELLLVDVNISVVISWVGSIRTLLGFLFISTIF
jgi:hypothetical protein